MKRRGKSSQDWTLEEDVQLLEDIKTGKPYAIVALKYKRTPTAIKTRVSRLRREITKKGQAAPIDDAAS
jgi:hypothetical protein